jgi:hypothetical protein
LKERIGKALKRALKRASEEAGLRLSFLSDRLMGESQENPDVAQADSEAQRLVDALQAIGLVEGGGKPKPWEAADSFLRASKSIAASTGSFSADHTIPVETVLGSAETQYQREMSVDDLVLVALGTLDLEDGASSPPKMAQRYGLSLDTARVLMTPQGSDFSSPVSRLSSAIRELMLLEPHICGPAQQALAFMGYILVEWQNHNDSKVGILRLGAVVYEAYSEKPLVLERLCGPATKHLADYVRAVDYFRSSLVGVDQVVMPKELCHSDMEP